MEERVMYKVLIVDDELSIRKGISISNPWNEWGFEVIGLAANGLEAISMIEKEKPHIVLSDIRMPKMDGIELMQYLNKNYPEIKIIILSGYNDFEYLNMSIKNSVMEYLLKPTDVDEFEILFRRMKQVLDEEQQKKEDYKNLVEQYEESREYRYIKQIDLLLKGYLEEEEECKLIQELEEVFGICFEHYAVMLCVIDDKQQYIGKERYLLKEKIVNLYNEQLEQTYQARFFLNTQEKIVGIIGSKNSFAEEFLLDLAKFLQKSVKETLNISISIGISKSYDQTDYLPQCYEQVRSSMRQKFLNEESHIVKYSDLNAEEFDYLSITFERELLERYLLLNNTTAIEEELHQVFLRFKDRIIKESDYIERMCLELLFYLSRWCMKYQVRLEQTMQKIGVTYHNIYELESLSEKEHFLYEILSELGKELEETKNQNRKSNSVANLVKEIIDKEYMCNNISLDYVADKVRKNSAYISKVFKNEIGYNFSDYLTKKRLQCSKELLKDFTVKIYEVAEAVGYTDASNFIKVFRKNYGISPSEYRNSLGRN